MPGESPYQPRLSIRELGLGLGVQLQYKYRDESKRPQYDVHRSFIRPTKGRLSTPGRHDTTRHSSLAVVLDAI